MKKTPNNSNSKKKKAESGVKKRRVLVNYPPRQCPHCNTIFVPLRKDQIFPNAFHRIEYYKAHGYVHQRHDYVILCERCGTEFTTTSPKKSKYCPDCKNLAWKERAIKGEVVNVMSAIQDISIVIAYVVSVSAGFGEIQPQITLENAVAAAKRLDTVRKGLERIGGRLNVSDYE